MYTSVGYTRMHAGVSMLMIIVSWEGPSIVCDHNIRVGCTRVHTGVVMLVLVGKDQGKDQVLCVTTILRC